MASLKFEGLAIGTRIKAYDFEPMEGRPDMYVVGEIIRTHNDPYDGYEILVTDSDHESRIGTTVIVPLEVSMGEFDNRITVIKSVVIHDSTTRIEAITLLAVLIDDVDESINEWTDVQLDEFNELIANFLNKVDASKEK